MSVTVFKPPALDKAAPIVDPVTGRITPYFQRFWQNLSFTAATGANSSVDVTNKVDKRTSVGWGAATGTTLKTTFATYVSPVISNPPTQAQVQAIADHVQLLSQHMKALIDAGLGSGLLGT